MESVQNTFNPAVYLDTIRQAYQEGHINYTGRRNPAQQAAANLPGEEATEFVAGGAQFVQAWAGSEVTQRAEDRLDEEYANKFIDMQDAFTQLYVAIGIASQRMQRDEVTTDTGKQVGSLMDMPEIERRAVLERLFSDFQDLNALRFGATGSGAPKQVFTGEYDVLGKEIYRKTDKDALGRTAGRRLFNMAYRELIDAHEEPEAEMHQVHSAGKLSPDEYRRLRRAYPEVRKNRFDAITITGSYRNARRALEQYHSH